MTTIEQIEVKAAELLEAIREEKAQVNGILEGKEITIRDLQEKVATLSARVSELEKAGGSPEQLQRIMDNLNAAESEVKGIVPDEE